MAKSNKQIIESEVKELQKLISWCEYYTAIGNPIEANKAQKEIEDQKRKINELRKLSEFLKENNISEAEAIERLQVQLFDPAKDFYAVLITASKELMKSVRDHTLDLEDPYQDGLFKLLQAGDKVNKSLKLAKLEAYPEEDVVDDEDSFLDRVNKKR